MIKLKFHVPWLLAISLWLPIPLIASPAATPTQCPNDDKRCICTIRSLQLGKAPGPTTKNEWGNGRTLSKIWYGWGATIHDATAVNLQMACKVWHFLRRLEKHEAWEPRGHVTKSLLPPKRWRPRVGRLRKIYARLEIIFTRIIK